MHFASNISALLLTSNLDFNGQSIKFLFKNLAKNHWQQPAEVYTSEILDSEEPLWMKFPQVP